jgi:hypothetical protein
MAAGNSLRVGQNCHNVFGPSGVPMTNCPAGIFPNTLFAAVCLLYAGGCVSYQSMNDEPAIRSEHLIGRRYVVGAEASFSTFSTSTASIFSGSSERTLVLSKGTLLHVSEAVRVVGGIGDSPPAVLGIVDSGPHKGEQIDVGPVSYTFSHYVRFDSYARSPTTKDQIDNPLIPLPDKPPDWLEVNGIPPGVKPIDSAVLSGATEDVDGVVRLYALRELIRRDPVAAVPLCGNLLDDPLSEVRGAAWDGLKLAGTNSAPILDKMIQHLVDPTEMDQYDAMADAVAAVGPAASTQVAAILRSGDRYAVQRAAEVLQKQGKAAAPYIDALVELLEGPLNNQSTFRSSEESRELSAVYDAVLAIDAATAIDYDIMQFRSSKPEIRTRAILHVGDFARDPNPSIDPDLRARAIGVLRSACSDLDPEVKREAINELRVLSSP